MKTHIHHSILSRVLAATCLGAALFGIVQLAEGECPSQCDSDRNMALGSGALTDNTTGFGNTAVGWEAMELNTTGFDNTALGFVALTGSMTGSFNIAIGNGAMAFNYGGLGNTAVGYAAMNGPNLSGSFNIALGIDAGVNLSTGDYNIDIGNEGVAGESGTIRIGTVGTQAATYIAGFARGTAVAVGITADGQLGVRASSARFNEAIQPMDEASEAILSLKPVTFHYKHELDPDGIPQFGLVAEDVEKVNPDLVARDEEGKPYTVRYEEVNAMLLNEFLKEHRKVQEMEANAAKQQKQIDALTAGLQKVSARLELSKSAPQTVSNNH
jgi:trimeric autotransporter adhesin